VEVRRPPARVHGHDWLYAIGDANGRALRTHARKYQARILGLGLAAEQRAQLGGAAHDHHDHQTVGVGVVAAMGRDCNWPSTGQKLRGRL